MTAWLVLVPLAPLTAALGVRVLGSRWSGLVASAGVAVALLALLLLGGAAPQINAVWLQSIGVTITVGLRMDGLARLMAWIVAAVGLLVTVYAIGTLAEERDQRRFFSTFAFFIGAMLVLVLADSFLLLFAAWEAVGVASFLLIGFWYDQAAPRRAAQRAFLFTRFGDLGLLLGWLLALRLTGTTQIDALLRAIAAGTIPAATLTLLALLCCAATVGKSAQLPLAIWLPDAMAGPTPVSALLHSATMVAAGVYLVLRLFPLFAAAPVALTAMLWIGGTTALVAGLAATVQTDLKRILAWSTVSQLGEMVFALGLGGPVAAALHLATHAAFKSTLFLAAGAVDHAAGTRDLRRLGGLWRAMPLTAATFGVAGLALADVPPFAGFWSEDAILAQAAARGALPAVLLLALIGLAGVYISQAAMAAFGSWPAGPQPTVHEPRRVMTIPAAVLAVAAALLGWAIHDRIAGLLGFTPSPNVSFGWRGAALVASLAGLAWGAWRVRHRGPVPAFGAWPTRIEWALDGATRVVSAAFMAVAGFVNNLETALDAGARILGNTTLRFGSNSGIERALDRGAHAAASITLLLGNWSEASETHGIAAATNQFARLVGGTGKQFRRVQNGNISWYIVGVVAWALLVGVAGSIIFWR